MIKPPDDLSDEISGKWFLPFIMARHLAENLWFKTPAYPECYTPFNNLHRKRTSSPASEKELLQNLLQH